MKWICILILFLSPFFIWGQKESVELQYLIFEKSNKVENEKKI